jgi:hypothetical protein
MTCVNGCGNGFITSADGFCSSKCRKEYKISKGCEYCRTPCKKDWKFGSFETYFSGLVICPECSIKSKDYHKREQEIRFFNEMIDEEIKKLKNMLPHINSAYYIANGKIYLCDSHMPHTINELKQCVLEMMKIDKSPDFYLTIELQNKIIELRNKKKSLKNKRDWIMEKRNADIRL